MRKRRFTEEQMVKILREADQFPVAEVAKKHGVSDVTIYAWRKRFGKLEPADVKRLRQLAQANAKLKKLLAARDLEIEVMKEVAAKNGERARSSSAGCVHLRTRRVSTASVRADVGDQVDAARPAHAARRAACAAGVSSRAEARLRRATAARSYSEAQLSKQRDGRSNGNVLTPSDTAMECLDRCTPSRNVEPLHSAIQIIPPTRQ